MKIISLVNSKGGVGKTTLAINLAREMQIHLNAKDEIIKKSKVLIVDADAQGSIRDWHDQGGHLLIDMIAMDRRQAISNLRYASLGYDYVFIDTPGNTGEIMAATISISDLVLVPIQPSPYDIWASADTVQLIKNRQALADGQPDGRFILNRLIPHTILSKDAKDYLHQSAFPYFNTSIHQRVIFAESANRGCTIYEGGNALAIDSIKALGNELREVLDGDK